MNKNIAYGAISTNVVAPKYCERPGANSESKCNPTLTETDVMSLTEVSSWLGIAEDLLKKMATGDTIPCFHPAKNTFFFSRRDLLAWLEENRRGRIKKTNKENNNEEE